MPKVTPGFVENNQTRRAVLAMGPLRADDPRVGPKRIHLRLLPKVTAFGPYGPAGDWTRERGQGTASEGGVVRVSPWLEYLPVREIEQCSLSERLHDEIVAFSSWVIATPTEQKITESIIASITLLIENYYAGSNSRVNATVSPFGSTVNGLAFPNSDINLEVMVEQKSKEGSHKIKVRGFKSLLTKAGFSPEQPAHVSISGGNLQSIRFRLGPRLLNRTVTLTKSHRSAGSTKSTAIASTQETKHLLGLYPALRPLVLVLKAVLTPVPLVHGWGLTSFGVVKLVSLFLQSNVFGRSQRDLQQPFESGALGGILINILYYFGFFHPEGMGQVLGHRDMFYVPSRQAKEPENARLEAMGMIRDVFQRAWNHLNEAYKCGVTQDILGPILGITSSMSALRTSLVNLAYSGNLERLAIDVAQKVKDPNWGPLASLQKEPNPNRPKRQKRGPKVVQGSKIKSLNWALLPGGNSSDSTTPSGQQGESGFGFGPLDRLAAPPWITGGPGSSSCAHPVDPTHLITPLSDLILNSDHPSSQLSLELRDAEATLEVKGKRPSSRSRTVEWDNLRAEAVVSAAVMEKVHVDFEMMNLLAGVGDLAAMTMQNGHQL